MQPSARFLGIALCILFVITAVVWLALMREDRHGRLTVTFLNIGQGDAIFLDTPSGRQVLIDGGPSRVVLRELSNVMPWYDRTIDAVVATHPDLDHIGGLPDIFERYKVGLFVESSVRDEEGTDAQALEHAVSKEGARRIVARRGDTIAIGDVRIDILSPDRAVPNVETNLGCLVARVVYGSTAFMLTCDAPDEIEEYLVRLDPASLRSNVLKAGHHGSKTSSSPAFIKAVAPEWAVFSRGCDNRYGHPAPEIVERYKEFDIPAFDTCVNGPVSFVSDGNEVFKR